MICPKAEIGRSGSIDFTSGSAASTARAAGPIDAAKPDRALWYVSRTVSPRALARRAAKASESPAAGRSATMYEDAGAPSAWAVAGTAGPRIIAPVRARALSRRTW